MNEFKFPKRIGEPKYEIIEGWIRTTTLIDPSYFDDDNIIKAYIIEEEKPPVYERNGFIIVKKDGSREEKILGTLHDDYFDKEGFNAALNEALSKYPKLIREKYNERRNT